MKKKKRHIGYASLTCQICYIDKGPDAGKDWRQEETGTTEDESHETGHEFEQALGVGDGQGSLACCSP